MALFNESDIIGQMIIYLTQNITGSLFVTYLFIVGFFILIAILFRLPLEITIPLVLPLLIIFAFVDQGFFSALAVMALYVAVLIGKRFITNN